MGGAQRPRAEMIIAQKRMHAPWLPEKGGHLKIGLWTLMPTDNYFF